MHSPFALKATLLPLGDGFIRRWDGVYIFHEEAIPNVFAVYRGHPTLKALAFQARSLRYSHSHS